MPEDLFGIAQALFVIAYMFVLRIGVPILVTLMIGAWLKRWLEERDAKEIPQAATPVSGNGSRCWDIKHCPDTERAKCVAAKRPDLPCWLALQVSDGTLKEMCYSCPVFTAHAPMPVKA
jgi:hypothetical protein